MIPERTTVQGIANKMRAEAVLTVPDPEEAEVWEMRQKLAAEDQALRDRAAILTAFFPSVELEAPIMISPGQTIIQWARFRDIELAVLKGGRGIGLDKDIAFKNALDRLESIKARIEAGEFRILQA